MDPATGASLPEDERRLLAENFAAALKASTEAARLEDAARRNQQLQWVPGLMSGET